ncbi:hypothetical protein MSSAC_0762 [Methanosarcina siciliae C2J]|uniref:Holliday junction resolvase n=3 Tax=Methanosarcina siciliae TaxID=38027 RepID=A0A0E3LA48_9EURY|nr:hypothetical protein [Methanosarcina siciliae]AKB27453.1 hypothetical protein MSSIT_0734 [Methanosarcina siciliae T4/M]AKB31396.1 hypothetical protein MSSIH_0706 [Methanosarcina siciliae HI350]AKB35352.1 hypothetical protein MSSAC_0762 [Methanosarcina siciliae C2J]
MTEFERVLVNSFNAYIKEKGIRAISYRLKQHRFTSQFLDVLVDSLDPDLYLGIECKSISVDKGANALYFSQHFTVDKKGIHQIERISDYLNRSGRKGFLAVELRLGTGREREAYMVPWEELEKFYRTKNLKLTVEEIRSFPEIKRNGKDYTINPREWERKNR